MRGRTIISVLVLTVAAVAIGYHLALWRALSPTTIRSTDYTSTYVAAQSWRAHDGADLYDPTVQLAGHQAIGTPPDAQKLAYVNPPLSAVVAAPFSGVGYLTSYRLFGVTQVLLIALSILIAVRAAPWPAGTPALVKSAVALAALAGTGTELVLLQAQWDGVAALGLAVAYAAWRSRRPAWAGAAIALAFGITKPHLAFGLVAFLLARRERRSTVAAVVTTLGMVVASVLLVGTHGTLAFLAAPGHSEDVSPLATMLGINGLAFSNLQAGVLAEVLSVAGCAIAVAVSAVLGGVSRPHPERLEAALAGAVLLSLLAAPHLLIHDLVILAPALVWCLARLVGTAPESFGGGRGVGVLLGWLALSQAAPIDAGNDAVGPPGRLVPWVLIAGAAVAVSASQVIRLSFVPRSRNPMAGDEMTVRTTA